MSAGFGAQCDAAALLHPLTCEKQCRAALATALHNAVFLALFFCIHAPALSQTPSTNQVRFQAVDVFVDSNDKPLAAYQLEFTVTDGSAKIVGIEGGEHPAFTHAPFYDPKAIQSQRAVLAAFSTQPAEKLPQGKTRVATIHLQISGPSEWKFETKLTAAASSSGKKIAASLSATEQGAK